MAASVQLERIKESATIGAARRECFAETKTDCIKEGVRMVIRQPIITVLGHVDHGKTKLLDAIRGTAVAEREAGAITQHIGATAMPIELIKKIAGELIEQYGFKVNLPGLLFIDTPGHAAFASLRERGGSIADLAVLVVDLTQGFQPQTIEAINILKAFKTPFVVAANKIDLLPEWSSVRGNFSLNAKQQSQKALVLLDEKIYGFVGKLHQAGFQSERFDRCADFSKQVPIVPLSAKTGEGLPELLMLLTGLSQRFLGKRLSIDENEAGKATIVEVKEEKGLGKTVDVILYSGMLRINDRIVLGGKQGVIETKVRALLLPMPLQDSNGHGVEKFLNVKEVHAAAGVKIAAPCLEDALAGSPLLVAKGTLEKAVVEKDVAAVKRETSAVGPVLRADTLGGLEAFAVLLEKEAKMQLRKADVGDVTRRDVMDAIAVKEKDCLKGIIFAFNVKVEEAAEEEAKKHEIKIFRGNVIYKLIEDFNQWVQQKEAERQQAALSQLTLPAMMRFLPGFVFRHNKPAIIGVKVLEGKLRPGVRLMNEKGIIFGRVAAVQVQGKGIEQAAKGQEVAVSIEKGVVGRNLKENKVYYTFIPQKQFPQLAGLCNFFNSDELELIEEIKKLVEKAKEEEEVAE